MRDEWKLFFEAALNAVTVCLCRILSFNLMNMALMHAGVGLNNNLLGFPIDVFSRDILSIFDM